MAMMRFAVRLRLREDDPAIVTLNPIKICWRNLSVLAETGGGGTGVPDEDFTPKRQRMLLSDAVGDPAPDVEATRAGGFVDLVKVLAVEILANPRHHEKRSVQVVISDIRYS